MQVDWGSSGTLAVGSIQRRLSFLVAVLCYGRFLYVEFTLSREIRREGLLGLSNDRESAGRTFERRKSQMNVDPSMCASSGPDQHWDQIDWKQCRHQVRRLQARIAKATREGRQGKVKALQRLLTHSFSGKALAVKRVAENQGR